MKNYFDSRSAFTRSVMLFAVSVSTGLNVPFDVRVENMIGPFLDTWKRTFASNPQLCTLSPGLLTHHCLHYVENRLTSAPADSEVKIYGYGLGEGFKYLQKSRELLGLKTLNQVAYFF